MSKPNSKPSGMSLRISLAACKTGVNSVLLVLKATPFFLFFVFKSAGVIHSVFVDHKVSMNIVSTVSFSFVHKMTERVHFVFHKQKILCTLGAQGF